MQRKTSVSGRKTAHRLISFALCLSLILSVTVFATDAADELRQDFNASALAFLQELEIITTSSDSIEFQTSLTNADTAELLYKMLNLDFLYSSDILPSDVPPEHPKATFIKAVIQLEIMSTSKSGLFLPDEFIEAKQMVSVLIDVLGYRLQANNKGGYPAGDWTQAVSLGLLRGTVLKIDDMLTFGQAVTLIANALETDLMQRESFGSSTSYAVTKGENILTLYWKLSKGSGRIQANSATGLLSKEYAVKGTVLIEGKYYQQGNTGAGALLGRSVTFYYDEYDTIAAVRRSDREKTIRLNWKLIEEVDIGNYLIYENTAGGSEKVWLSNTFDVIYNDVVLFDFTQEDLLPSSGFAELLDYNGDGYFDVYFIYEYSNYIVANINIADVLIVDYFTNDILDLNESDGKIVNYYTVDSRSGLQIQANFQRVRRNDILSVMVSEDNSVITVYISNQKVRLIPEESFEDSIMAEDKTYTLAKNYVEALDSENARATDIVLGVEGELSLDYFGLIAFYREALKTEYYGFMIKMGISGGLSKTVQLRVLSERGEWQTLQTSKSVNYNGDTIRDMSTIYNEIVPDNVQHPQMIKYSLDSEGNISVLKTATDKTAQTGYEGYTIDKFTKDASLSSAYYKNKSKSFNKKYSFDSPTIIFSIPRDKVAIGEEVDEDDIAVLSGSVFLNDQSYSVDVYDAEDTHVAKVLVWTDNATDLWERRLMYVNKKSYVIDEKGQRTVKLTGFFQGVLKSYICRTEEIAEQVLPGDVLQINIMTNGKLRDVKRMFTISPRNVGASDCLPMTNNVSFAADGTSTVIRSRYGLYIGNVKTVNYTLSDFMLYTTDPSVTWQFRGTGITFLILNMEKGTYEAANISRLMGGANSSRVLVHDRYSETQDIILLD